MTLSVIWDFIYNALTHNNNLSTAEKMYIKNIVTNAISFTETHISRTRINNKDVSSQILSTIWLNAANKLRNYNNENVNYFANALETKSAYWSNPVGNRGSINLDYSIKLTAIKAQLKQIVL